MKFRISPMGSVIQLCEICGGDTNLVDAKKYAIRSVDVIVKLCRIPCVPPLVLVLMGYSYDVEPWEEDTE